MSLRTLTVLAGVSAAACVALSFTRPDGGWEWLPAICGLAVFGVLAGRRVTRAPYPHVAPALALALVIPLYPIIAGMNRGRALSTPDLAIDRATTIEPWWVLVYGSVFLFAFLPVFVVRGADLTRRVFWSYLLAELLAYTGFVVYPTELPRPAGPASRAADRRGVRGDTRALRFRVRCAMNVQPPTSFLLPA